MTSVASVHTESFVLHVKAADESYEGARLKEHPVYVAEVCARTDATILYVVGHVEAAQLLKRLSRCLCARE